MTFTLRQRLAAEFCGTYALVFAGAGAIVIDGLTDGGVSHIGIALTFGLIVMAMIYAVGEVSGCHINPAVTVGFWAARRFDGTDVLPYIVSQSLGAMAAGLTLRLLFPDATTLGATLPAGSAWQSFVLELLLTLMLMFVILSVSSGAREKGLMAGIAIGGIIALEALFAGPISGASMNPARSLGPALVSFQLHSLWLYLIAPTLGAVLAVPAFQSVYGRPSDQTSPAPENIA